MSWTRGQTIGHGSTASVSMAATFSGDLFAVKSAELQNSQSLQKEESFLSILNSPHIVTYKGFDVTKEGNKSMYNLFLEYVPGGTLTDAVRRRGGPLGEDEIRVYTCQILRGLEYIHSIGIAHCDIKGQNILIGKNGALIADFGCSKWTNEVATSGLISGTPLYMAPEVTRGEYQGCEADIWALGCLIIEMATANSPWSNVNDPFSILYTIAFSRKTPEIPDFLCSQTRDFLQKCLIQDPKIRWTAKELLKHAFVDESIFKNNKTENADVNSPISILDQGIWSSVSETDSIVAFNQSGLLDLPAWRIQRLELYSGEAKWRLIDDDRWITVRSNVHHQSETSRRR